MNSTSTTSGGCSSQKTAEQTADPDADLLALIAHGAVGRVLEGLMTRYGDAVYRMCCASLRDRRLAEDVHQQIFLDVYQRIGRFQPRIPLRAWLFWRARNRVANAGKARRRERARLAPEDASEPSAPAPSIPVRLDGQQLQRALKATIAQLPDDLRDLLVLRFQDDLSFPEMALVVGERADTLERRLHRAMPRVRRELRRTLARLARFSP